MSEERENFCQKLKRYQGATLQNIIIYGKPGCSYCDRAKQFLSIRFLPYGYVDITDPTLPQYEKDVVNGVLATGYKTLPMIFINGKFIGGYTELEGRSFE